MSSGVMHDAAVPAEAHRQEQLLWVPTAQWGRNG